MALVRLVTFQRRLLPAWWRWPGVRDSRAQSEACGRVAQQPENKSMSIDYGSKHQYSTLPRPNGHLAYCKDGKSQRSN